MRYRTGPVGGTVVMTVLAVMGINGLVTLAVSGGGGFGTGSIVFSIVVIGIFIAFAVVGLNDLRGVRTERRPDGTAVLKLPGLRPGRWWRVIPADDIARIELAYSGGRSRIYSLSLWTHDFDQLTSDSVSVAASRRVALADTKAGRMVARIRLDLGLPAA